MGLSQYFVRPSRRTLIVGGIVVALALAGLAARVVAMWLHEREIQRRLELCDRAVRYHAARQGLPPELVRGVIRAESGGRPDARSNRDAIGLMQIRQDTKQNVIDRFKVPDGDLTDPEYNIFIGTIYLRMMLDRFDGDVELALAAYNWGPANVTKLRKAHPDVPSVELIDKYGPFVTAAYCRSILEESGVPASLPTSRPGR
ncbi:MAG: lytic transglycosylase domain-containing protein [Planctomycetota bacterium]|nr:lytic transglycosylase domain-containing protein [Planctomycetota bacterium]